MAFNKRLCILFLFLAITIQAYSQKVKIDSLENALKQQNKADTVRVKTLNNLAYYYNGNNQLKLKSCASEALALSLRLNYPQGEARAYIGLSQMYTNDNANPLALEYFNRASKIYKTLNDKSRCAGVLSGISTYYTMIKDYKLAMAYDLQALELVAGLNNSRKINCLSNIGDDYERINRFAEAHDYYNQAYNLAVKIGYKDLLPFCYLNLASIHLKEKKYQKALYYCTKARELKNTMSAKETAEVSLVESQVYYSIKDYTRARQSLDSSAAITRNTQVLDNRLKILLVNYLLDSATHNYPSALNYSYRYRQLNDSVVNVKKNQIVAFYNFKSEFQKQESENQRLRIIAEKNRSIISKQHITQAALLSGLIVICSGMIYLKRKNDEIKIKNRIINEQNRTLENSNIVKDKLFSVIAHDLRSPITQVVGLLNLWETGDMDQNDVATLTPVVKDGIINTLELLDNLLIWSKNQLQGFNFNPESFNLHKLVAENISDLRNHASQKQITVKNLVPADVKLYADYEMLKIVLRNLMSNAIKFTHLSGSIIINSYAEKNQIVIVVEDTGVGIKKADKHKVFSFTTHTTLGTANEKGTGIGLKICREFIELNKGKIWMESEEGIGSKFYISLPVSTAG